MSRYIILSTYTLLSEMNMRVRSEGGADNIRKLVNGEMAVKI